MAHVDTGHKRPNGERRGPPLHAPSSPVLRSALHVSQFSRLLISPAYDGIISRKVVDIKNPTVMVRTPLPELCISGRA